MGRRVDTRGDILHSSPPSASQLSYNISYRCSRSDHVTVRVLLALFYVSPECSSCRSSLMFAGKLGGVRLSSLVRQVEDLSGMPEHTLIKLSEEVLDCPSSST